MWRVKTEEAPTWSLRWGLRGPLFLTEEFLCHRLDKMTPIVANRRIYGAFISNTNARILTEEPFDSVSSGVPHILTLSDGTSCLGSSSTLTVPCFMLSKCLTDMVVTLWKHSNGRWAEMLQQIAIQSIYSRLEGLYLAQLISSDEEPLPFTLITVRAEGQEEHGGTSRTQVIKKLSQLWLTPLKNPFAAWNPVTEISSAPFNKMFETQVRLFFFVFLLFFHTVKPAGQWIVCALLTNSVQPP